YNPLLSPFVSLTDTDRDGMPMISFLQSATFCNDISMVRLLLELGADPNFMDPVLAFGGEYSSGTRQDNFQPGAMVPIRCCETREGDTALNVCRTREATKALLEAQQHHAPQVLHDLLMVSRPGKGNALHYAVGTYGNETLTVLLEAVQRAGCNDTGLALRKAAFTARNGIEETVLCKLCQYTYDKEDAAQLVLDTMMHGIDRHTTAMAIPLFTWRRCVAWRASLRKMLESLSSIDDGLCREVLGMEVFRTKWTPLHFAAWTGQAKCAQMLVEYGADWCMRDVNGRTAMDVARIKIGNGDDPKRKGEAVLLMDDHEGFTPVHAAALRGWETVLRKMLKVLSAIDDGLCGKVLGMKARTDKRTTLHLAARKGHAKCVRMVLEHGAVRGMKDRFGKTAMMIANSHDWVEVMKVL
ncbi:hypothetical protein HDU96_003981, partial [Phlyctochytrium bullatum]